MFKLKSTLAACVALAMIGGIVACTTRPATSGDADKETKPRPESTVAPGTTAAKSAPTETMVAQADAVAPTTGSAAEIAGNVQIAGSPIAGATVTLYAAGIGAPTQLAQGQTDGDGAFKLDGGQASARPCFT